MSLLGLGAVTVAGYRVSTRDDTSAASAVSAALLEAEGLVEERLGRRLASAERTGTFRLWPNGRVYPDAWPITAAQIVDVEDPRTLLGATPDGGPFIGLDSAPASPRATVTWTGGFTAETLPVTLARAIYDLAYAVLTGPGAPSGAKAASVGDASVTFATAQSGGVDVLVPGMSDRIAKWRNRRVG